jgi:hypothetical protein
MRVGLMDGARGEGLRASLRVVAGWMIWHAIV